MTTVSAQTIRINEVSSSNSLYFDEDGDTPDWIELYNFGSQTISLNNWTLSDDIQDLGKWAFPNLSLTPESYILLWASSKDRPNLSYFTTLINQGDIFQYLIPTSEPNPNWKNLDFDDSNWLQGGSGFGYDDGDDETITPDGTLSVYLRKLFNISDLQNLNSLILDIDYDDAFVAYINGIEVARANINGSPPAYNSGTIQNHEALMYNGGSPERFIITDLSPILIEGENILTIQGHNINSTSSDFTLIPFLSAIFSSPIQFGTTPPEILGFISDHLHTNFKISSNSETITLSNSSGEIIDQLTVENLPPDTSLGVYENSPDLVIYSETTPGYQNSNNYFTGAIDESVVFSNNGGFLSESISLSLSGNSSGQVIRYTTDATI
ncbi:MAG: lamin tail domain-containing protein, partial [Flavobacteriales bacterium]